MYPTGNSYPLVFTMDPPDRIANWRPLVQWILAIPHLIIISLLRMVSQLLAVASWFVILFTGRLPAELANFQAMYLRYSRRTTTYALFLREEYPPFTFEMAASDPGDDPRVRVDVRPALENRDRLSTAFRLIFAIPHFVVLVLLSIAAAVAFVVAFFAVLFTGRWPAGLRDFVFGTYRWWLRAEGYVLLLTDEYPPFSLD
jgi:hypothetical protein